MPVKVPLAASMVPIPAPATLLLQVPPPASLSVLVAPGHTVVVPIIEPAPAFTVTVLVALQPLEMLYVMVVTPVFTPVTTPEVLTVATEATLLVQVPPRLRSLSVADPPVHSAVAPVIGDSWFTLTTTILAQPPLIV